MKSPKALILCGDGINSENEMALAFESSGFQVDKVLVKKAANLDFHHYHVLVIPGGFSFADNLGSGKVLSLKIKYLLQNKIDSHLKNKRLILGVCNGFQALLQLDLLSKEKTYLLKNRQEKFINKWVKVKVQSSKSPWLKNFSNEAFYLPIRHAEGRFYHESSETNLDCITYLDDVNGAKDNIAGICDDTGLVLGMMPHPEAAFKKFQIPFVNKTTFAKNFFDNAYHYVRNQL